MAMASDLYQRLNDALSKPGSASSDFDLNTDVILPEGRVLRPAAVLIGVRCDTQSVILTKRSSKLKHHPGQIAFPGGKQDKTDTNLTETALREAREEIGLPSAQSRVLGQLDSHETVTGFEVSPILSVVEGQFDITPEKGEVEDVFDVPLDFLIDPANFRIESRRWQGRRRYFYTIPFGPYYIWGATARILRGLADRMQP